MKKSGSRTPRVELAEMGPSVDLVMRRTRLATQDLYKRACKKPKALKVCHAGATLPYFGKRKQVTKVMFLVKEQNMSVISSDVNGIS